MRVPQSPHNLRKFVSTSSSDSDTDSTSESDVKKPPKNSNLTSSSGFHKNKKELRPRDTTGNGDNGNQHIFQHRSRERTRISAVQRLVERKMAQKEKDREKERDLLFRRSSSVGSNATKLASFCQLEQKSDKSDLGILSRSLSRDRALDSTSKTYIKISSGKPTKIRESSPTKKIEQSVKSTDDILNKPWSPLKSTEFFKDLSPNQTQAELGEKNPGENQPQDQAQPSRKISFTTEKTIMINSNDQGKADQVKSNRKISIDINYVFDQADLSPERKINVIQDEKFKQEQRRISLEKRSQQRSSSLSSMSTSSASSASSEASSEASSVMSTPEPMPRQSKQRKMSTPRNINIIVEDEISQDHHPIKIQRNDLPQPKTSFHRRFSQDHGISDARKTSLNQVPMARKISLQNNTTINTDSLADQKKEEGNQLYLAKNYREALQRYNEAISLCPRCPAFYGNRAACHMMLGQFVQALEDARTSVTLDPNFVRGYVRVAKCCLALGQLHAARQAINTAMSINKDESINFDLEKTSLEFLDKHDSNLKLAFQQADYRKALYHIEQSLKMASASLRLKISRAECLAFLARYQEAQEVANDILRNDSTNIEAIYIRGLCLYYEDILDKALSHFQQVLKLAPDHAKAKEAFKRARQLKTKKEEGNEAFKANQFDEAFKLYTEALLTDRENKGTNAKLYFNRATVAAKLKKWSLSVEDCTTAISLDESYIKAYLRRAKSYMELEKYEEAVRDYERVHKMDRSNFEYRQFLSQAKNELKKSLKKDYYKILGIDQSANEEDIKKAYKKRALEHHPDRHVGASDQEKSDHEQKFKDISEAYSVLSDAKKRQRYDVGQDLDNNSGYQSDASSNFSHFGHQMDAAQMFKAFFGSSHPGMNHAFHHHFRFGSSTSQVPGSGAFFQFT